MKQHGLGLNLLLLSLSSCLAVAGGELLARLLLTARNVGPSFSTFDPFLGKVHKKSFRARRYAPEFTMTFTTNSQGYRGAERYAHLDERVVTVLFVGDSYTEGYGVNDGEEFPSRLGDRLIHKFGGDNVEVVNAGVGDTGTGRTLRFLRRLSQEAGRPLILVYEFSPNDFRDDAHEGMFRLSPTGELVESREEMSEPMTRRWQEAIEKVPGLSQSYFLAAAMEGVRDGPRQLSKLWTRKGPGASEEEQLTYKLVAEILRLAKAKRWPIIMLIFELEQRQEDELRRVGGQWGATIVQIPRKFERPDLYYKIDAHWNRDGHAYVADRIGPLIEQCLENLRASRRHDQ